MSDVVLTRHALARAGGVSTGRTKKWVDRAIAAVMQPFAWRPMTTAPFNRNLKLRVADDGGMLTLPFPCRRTNAGRWINADLGTALPIDPIGWCIWSQSEPIRVSVPLRSRRRPTVL
jgi:hypothetical protein